MTDDLGRRDSGAGALTLEGLAGWACWLEAWAPKVGNVHPGACFRDVSFIDYAASAWVVGDVFRQHGSQRLGILIDRAVAATRAWAHGNTNLGLILVIGPLYQAALRFGSPPTPASVHRVLAGLSEDDGRCIYRAIRRSRPGGLGRVAEYDVAGDPPARILDAMRVAAPRDLIARQFVTDFDLVFHFVEPELCHWRGLGWPLSDVIVYTQLRLLAVEPDSLIARKVGMAVAEDAAARAAALLRITPAWGDAFRHALRAFDEWLRGDGNQRNPGATADLIGGGLLLGLYRGTIGPPWDETLRGEHSASRAGESRWEHGNRD